MALKIDTSVAEWLKLKNQRVLKANSYVCRIFRGKTGRKAFLIPPSGIWLREYNEMEEEIKNPETSMEYTI